jgi:redox-sensitive bicupin YhaK (pirin superfamily)
VLVHQNASVYVSSLPAGQSVEHTFEQGTGGYLYLISGEARVNDERLSTGDAATIQDEPEIAIAAEEETELLMVEVRLD